MSILTNKIIRISPEESANFIKRFNSNVITEDQKNLCKIAGHLFRHEGGAEFGPTKEK